MAKKPAKQNIRFRLQPCTLEFLRDVTQHGIFGYIDEPTDSMRKFLELLIKDFIYNALKNDLLRQVMHCGMSHEQLCKIWLKYRRAERGEEGYKVYRRTEKDGKSHVGKVVAIFSPEDLPDKNAGP